MVLRFEVGKRFRLGFWDKMFVGIQKMRLKMAQLESIKTIDFFTITMRIISAAFITLLIV